MDFPITKVENVEGLEPHIQTEIDQQRPIKTFTSVEQFGGNKNMTEEELLLAMPNNSFLCLVTDNYEGNDFPNFSLKQNGMLTIKKADMSNYADLTFVDQSFRVWRTTYKSWQTPKFIPWYRMAVNGALSMPSNIKINIDVSSLAVESADWNYLEYVAPADGWITFTGGTGSLKNTRSIIQLRNLANQLTISELLYGLDWSQRDIYIPCAKGQAVSFGVVNCKGSFAYFIYSQSEV